jgi:tight adherence protein B
MTIFLLAILAFVAASSLVIALILGAEARGSSTRARIRKRITTVSPAQQQTTLRINKGDALYSGIPQLQRLLSQMQLARKLDLLLNQANINMSVGLFLLLSVAMGVVAYTVLFVMFTQSIELALIGALLTAVGPYLYLLYLSQKRIRKFLEQMPDGLDIMAQGLQAGLGLSQSQAYVAKEMPDPIGTEFSTFMEELNLGLPLNRALNNFQERIPIQETRLLSTALTVQRDVGGSLAELLNKLSDVVRERFRIEREIKTLTAQNRMAAIVVCSIPPVLFVAMSILNPSLMQEVKEHRIGWIMLMAALTLEVIGIFMFRRLLRLHI